MSEDFSTHYVLFLTDAVRKEIASTLSGKFEFMSKEAVLEIESGWECDGNEGETCDVKIASQLQADLVVSGEVFKEDKEYRLTLRLTRVWSKEPVNMVQRVEYTKGGLETALRAASVELVRALLVGRVDVTSIPTEAEIFVDKARSRECTTPCSAIALTPGKHILQAKLEGYLLLEKEISIAAGERKAHRLEFPTPMTLLDLRAVLVKGSSHSPLRGEARLTPENGGSQLSADVPGSISLPIGAYRVEVTTKEGVWNDNMLVKLSAGNEIVARFFGSDQSMASCKKSLSVEETRRVQQGGSCSELALLVGESGDCRRKLKANWKSAEKGCAKDRAASICGRVAAARKAYDGEVALYRSLVTRMRKVRCTQAP
jgi:hypothetical protein